jgi:D-threo-aldose 1-dehydrogenase
VTHQLLALGETGIATSRVGLGCATLFHLPRPSERRAVLHAAFAEGITHFDVAPMYGFGLAESELGSFLQGRRGEITVTTKFGIDPTPLGRAAGRLQRPVRSTLRRLPRTGRGLKSSGRGPASGAVGRLLYTSESYTPETVRRSLDRSLAALHTDYVDVFLVHDPTDALLSDSSELADYLASEVARGRIRTWGSAADVNQPAGEVRTLSESSPVLQFRDDVFEPEPWADTAHGQAFITFGIMERALPSLTAYFERSPAERVAWSGRLGFDAGGPGALAGLLLRQALHRNPSGPVLFSSTREDRVRDAARMAAVARDPAAMSAEADVVGDLTAAVRRDEDRSAAG